ncbi:MAG: ankyrin repeat domain-containing protein [Lentisphaerae bacterium]|nr:ankyrin repeat domain-containing protein [Lentisphaerota bacterium]
MKEDKNRRHAVITFWEQYIFWEGARYRLYVLRATPETTDIRGWVCKDSALLPGYNIFAKRRLSEQEISGLLKANEEYLLSRKKTREDYEARYGNMELNDALLETVSASFLSTTQKVTRITALVAQGANVNAVSLRGFTPLSQAAFYLKDTNIVTVLLDMGANPNARSSGGWTALHTAAKFAPASVVELLILRGADPTMQTERGETPLSLAIPSGYADPRSIDILKKYELKAGHPDE